MNSYSVKSQGVNGSQQGLMIGIWELLYSKREAIPVQEGIGTVDLEWLACKQKKRITQR